LKSPVTSSLSLSLSLSLPLRERESGVVDQVQRDGGGEGCCERRMRKRW